MIILGVYYYARTVSALEASSDKLFSTIINLNILCLKWTFCQTSTYFSYLGQPTTSGLYSLPRDSLILGIVHGALIQRLEVYTSYGLNRFAQYEESAVPLPGSSTSPSQIHLHEVGSGPVCAMDVPNYSDRCSGRAPRPTDQPDGVYPSHIVQPLALMGFFPRKAVLLTVFARIL